MENDYFEWNSNIIYIISMENLQKLYETQI